MSNHEMKFLQALNCFEFAIQIWSSRQTEKYDVATRAYNEGKEIYSELYPEPITEIITEINQEKNTCEEEQFEF